MTLRNNSPVTGIRTAVATAAVAISLATTPMIVSPVAAQDTTTNVTDLTVPPAGFEVRTIEANGVSHHVVTGGAGPAVVLLHGWPESWVMWREVMPRLIDAGYTVIAPDLRGMGDSSIPADGDYDAATVASDVRAVAGALGHERYHLVSHDIGGWGGYAHAFAYPDATITYAALDVVMHDATYDAVTAPSRENNFWHFTFFDAEGVPEFLFEGRIGAFLQGGFDASEVTPGAVEPEERALYVANLERPGRLTAGFGHYRAVEANVAAAEAAKLRGTMRMPVLALGAAPGKGSSQILVDQMRAAAGETFEGRVVETCGHFMPTEYPGTVVDALLTHFERAE